jgi:hypothetical protein
MKIEIILQISDLKKTAVSRYYKQTRQTLEALLCWIETKLQLYTLYKSGTFIVE